MKRILRDSDFTLALFMVLAIALVIGLTGCNANKVSGSQPDPTPTPTPTPTAAAPAAPSLTGNWQITLISSNPSNQNTVLEANLTETGSVAAANSQNVLAFGLQTGHTQIDGSPITFTGQCGAANTISITLNSYTWNSGDTEATSDVSLAFTEGSYQFSGTGSGLLGPNSSNPPTGRANSIYSALTGTYSSSGACADSGTWTATFSNGNISACCSGTGLPYTADPNTCSAGWDDAEGGEGITSTDQNSPGQTFAAAFSCGLITTNGRILEYTANGTVIGQVEFGSGQKMYYPQGLNITTGTGQPYVVDTFNWYVFAEITGSQTSTGIPMTMYAYNPDGTFVTDFDGTCADAPDSTGTNCN